MSVTSVATRVLSAPAGPGLAGLHIECLILSLACRDASVKRSAQTRLIPSVPTDTAIIFSQDAFETIQEPLYQV